MCVCTCVRLVNMHVLCCHHHLLCRARPSHHHHATLPRAITPLASVWARLRKDTYLVQKDGDVKQIGSTCLRDFLGHNAPKTILARAAWSTNVLTTIGGFDNEDLDGTDHPDGPDGVFVRDYARYDSVGFLARVAAVVRSIGWVSGKVAFECAKTSTKDDVLSWIHTRDSETIAYYKSTTGGVQDKDTELAKAALAWARNELKPRNDYEENLKTAAVNEDVTARATGILASLIVTYSRHVEREIKRKKLAEGWAKEFAEKVGTRREFSGTVFSSRGFDGDYGVRTRIVIKEDGTDCQLIWWATGERDIEQGDVVTLKGTVKKQEIWKDTYQTVLTRCTIIKRVRENNGD